MSSSLFKTDLSQLFKYLGTGEDLLDKRSLNLCGIQRSWRRLQAKIGNFIFAICCLICQQFGLISVKCLVPMAYHLLQYFPSSHNPISDAVFKKLRMLFPQFGLSESCSQQQRKAVGSWSALTVLVCLLLSHVFPFLISHPLTLRIQTQWGWHSAWTISLRTTKDTGISTWNSRRNWSQDTQFSQYSYVLLKYIQPCFKFLYSAVRNCYSGRVLRRSRVSAALLCYTLCSSRSPHFCLVLFSRYSSIISIITPFS